MKYSFEIHINSVNTQLFFVLYSHVGKKNRLQGIAMHKHYQLEIRGTTVISFPSTADLFHLIIPYQFYSNAMQCSIIQIVAAQPNSKMGAGELCRHILFRVYRSATTLLLRRLFPHLPPSKPSFALAIMDARTHLYYHH